MAFLRHIALRTKDMEASRLLDRRLLGNHRFTLGLTCSDVGYRGRFSFFSHSVAWLEAALGRH